jgi:hypothetical protein
VNEFARTIARTNARAVYEPARAELKWLRDVVRRYHMDDIEQCPVCAWVFTLDEDGIVWCAGCENVVLACHRGACRSEFVSEGAKCSACEKERVV